MLPYANIIDCAYLPEIKNIEDDIHLNELNESYDFAVKNRCRSFCTYLTFISHIERKNYPTKLCPVIDFPSGHNTSEDKIFDCGFAYKACQIASASEVDIVLNPNLGSACLDIAKITRADINEKMGIKYIIELGHRDKHDIIDLLTYLNESNCKFVKTNTGKLPPTDLDTKLELVTWLSKQTKLPIKVSGGVKTPEILEAYKKIIGDRGIFGVSYSTLKEW